MSTLAERFEEKVDRNGPLPPKHPELGPCHLWLGSMHVSGSGQVRVESRLILAPRLAWFLKHGAYPVRGAVHRCEVKACVNVAHLADGTRADGRPRPCRKCGSRDRLPPRKGTPLGNCRVCHLEREMARHAALTPEQRATKASRERTRLYGISREDQDRLYLAQRGLCGSCGIPIEQYAPTTHLDHRHPTAEHPKGEVRGYLCDDCNVAAGRLKDSPANARGLASYLESPPAFLLFGVP